MVTKDGILLVVLNNKTPQVSEWSGSRDTVVQYTEGAADLRDSDV